MSGADIAVIIVAGVSGSVSIFSVIFNALSGRKTARDTAKLSQQTSNEIADEEYVNDWANQLEKQFKIDKYCKEYYLFYYYYCETNGYDDIHFEKFKTYWKKYCEETYGKEINIRYPPSADKKTVQKTFLKKFFAKAINDKKLQEKLLPFIENECK